MNWPTENSLPKQQRLESLDGWIGDTRSDSWEGVPAPRFPHCPTWADARVSDGYRTPDGFLLGRWVSHQRIAFGNSKLSLDRRRRLESLPGWVWDVLSDNWDRRYEEVATYARDHGTSAVPQSYRTAESWDSFVGIEPAHRVREEQARPGATTASGVAAWLGVANAVMAPVRHPRGHRDGRSVSLCPRAGG